MKATFTPYKFHAELGDPHHLEVQEISHPFGADLDYDYSTLGNPVPISAEIGTIDEYTIVITFNNYLNEILIPSFSCFISNGIYNSGAINGITINDDKIYLTIDKPAYYGDSITVDYIKPVLDPLKDIYDQKVYSFSAFPVTNNVPICTEYATVLVAMTNDPAEPDKIKQNAMLNSLVLGGYFAKAEFLDIFAIHTNAGDEVKINWKNPGGLFEPTYNGVPVFTQYFGITGNSITNACMNLEFTPSINGTLIGKNNICVIVGIGNDLSQTKFDFGSADGVQYLAFMSRNATNNFYTECNDITPNSIANANGKAHYAMSRGNAANYDKYRNYVKTNVLLLLLDYQLKNYLPVVLHFQ